MASVDAGTTPAWTLDRDPSRVALAESLDAEGSLLTALALSVLAEVDDEDMDCADLDDLRRLLACRMLRLHPAVERPHRRRAIRRRRPSVTRCADAANPLWACDRSVR